VCEFLKVAMILWEFLNCFEIFLLLCIKAFLGFVCGCRDAVAGSWYRMSIQERLKLVW
jgi:hypothetical protein